MMKKLSKLFLILLLMQGLTACFEIREEVDIRENGSGTYALLLDMSQSAELIKMAISFEGKDKNLLSRADSSFNRGMDRFNGIQGISNPKSIANKEDYIFGMQFDFDNINALNAALNDLNNEKDSGEANSNIPVVYKYSKGKLERNGNFYLSNISRRLDSNPGSGTDNNKELQMLLDGATYAWVVRTPGKIRKYSNKAAELSYTKKELRYSASLRDIMEGKANISNEIRFK